MVTIQYRQSSEYVWNKSELYLSYLRTEVFDYEQAAVRLARHLELLYEYFGTAALLRRRLYVTDLGPQELVFFKIYSIKE